MPKLSIITINYNNLEGLKKTFESVFAQTFQDFEYIVIDGGSTDGSKEYIAENDDKINYWVTEPDKGVYHAMNKGIVKASGEYLLFINSGDELFENNTIEKSHSNLHTEEIIAGNLNFISEKNNYTGKALDEVSFIFMYHNTIWHPSTFIKKEAFAINGLYDEEMKICSDWKWFILAIFKQKMSYKHINITIAKFYLDGISSSTENRDVIKKEKEDTFTKYFNFSAIDFEKINEITEERKERIILKDKLESLKKSRLLKLLYKLGIFKAYKYL